MDVQRAMALINDLAYKPEWQLTPLDMSAGDFGRIIVIVEFRAPNSNREQARDGYPTVIDVSTTTSLIELADHPTEIEFLRRVIDEMIEIETHEIREFFRRRSQDYAAPFHPHRPEGCAVWELTSTQAALPA